MIVFVFLLLSLSSHLDVYHDVVQDLHLCGLKGPVAHDLAWFAIARRLQEDGFDRPPGLSINGMCVGSPNREVIASLPPKDIKLSKIRAPDGNLSYRMTGPDAHQASTLAIALWYHKILTEWPSIKPAERAEWQRLCWVSRERSVDEYYAIDSRTKLLERVDRMYGPGSASTRRIRFQLKPLIRSRYGSIPSQKTQ